MIPAHPHYFVQGSPRSFLQIHFFTISGNKFGPCFGGAGWGLGAFSGEVLGSCGVNLRWGLGLRPKKFGLFPARFLFFWGPAVVPLLDNVDGVDSVVGLLCLVRWLICPPILLAPPARTRLVIGEIRT
jgi:hypothetical protein